MMNPHVKPETIDNVILQVDGLAQSELHKTYTKMAKMFHTHFQKCSGVNVFQDVH